MFTILCGDRAASSGAVPRLGRGRLSISISPAADGYPSPPDAAAAAGHARADEVGGQVGRVGVKREAHGGSPRVVGRARESYGRTGAPSMDAGKGTAKHAQAKPAKKNKVRVAGLKKR